MKSGRIWERQARRRRVARSLSDRCRMILRCADGLTNKAVAIELGVHEHTVGKWRRRFLKERIEGLSDEPRPGRPRTLSDEKVAAVIERTLETTPATRPTGSVRWPGRAGCRTRRSGGYGRPSACSRTARRPSSSPAIRCSWTRWRHRWDLSPPDRALVLCVDEKSQIQALDRIQPVLPMLPGMPSAAHTTTSVTATTSLFAALDVAWGRVIGKCYRRHRAREFLDFLKEIDRRVPEGLDVHIVMDNYATHKTAASQSKPGWHGGRTGMSTLRRLRRRGSIRSNAGSPN